jgi:hypothetical protein
MGTGKGVDVTSGWTPSPGRDFGSGKAADLGSLFFVAVAFFVAVFVALLAAGFLLPVSGLLSVFSAFLFDSAFLASGLSFADFLVSGFFVSGFAADALVSDFFGSALLPLALAAGFSAASGFGAACTAAMDIAAVAARTARKEPLRVKITFLRRIVFTDPLLAG